MKLLKLAVYSLMMCCVMSCSESATEINEKTAQQMYNSIKGTYVGNVMVDNIPQAVYVSIANDFSVRQLPLKPILQRIFNKESELTQALASAKGIIFTAPTDQMTIIKENIYLSMVPTDWVFSVTVNDQTYQVTAMTEAEAYVNYSTNILTLNMNVTELLCNGKSYDVKTNRINYYIDIANKQKTE